MNDSTGINAPANLFAEYAPGADRIVGDAVAGLVIRPATPADRDALATIAQQREGGTLAEHAARIERGLDGQDARPDAFWLTAEIDGQVVGFGRAGFFTPVPDAPPNAAPAGYYLFGVTVRPEFRRRGIGHALTVERLRWIAKRADVAYYFANAQNRASIDLHARLGFVELTRDFFVPGASFVGGAGILFRANLRSITLSAEAATNTPTTSSH